MAFLAIMIPARADERPEPEIQPEKLAENARKLIGQVHLFNAMDGSVVRFFTCYRCERSMPDSAFACLGPRFTKGRRHMMALHPHCHTCRRQAKGRWAAHPSYKPDLDRYWSGRLSLLRGNAESRGIFFGLDAEDLLGKYLEQDGRCALTGLPFDIYGTGSRGIKSQKKMAAPSVDRIDSAKHYTIDNIQLVLTVVNLMKGELPQDVFLEFCQQISVHNMLA